MRKLALLLTLLTLILCGCQSADPADGIEFFTLHDDIWAPVTSSDAAEVPEAEITTDAPTDDVTCNYVLNISSKKFHDPTCSSVGKIKAENREYFSGERQELLTKGFEPCKVCNP